jgi:small conductance mechanosensitive channel
MDNLQAIWAGMNWETALPQLIRIAVIILIALLASFILARLLKRFENSLVRRGVATGEVLSDSRKRAQTLMALARQGLILLIWLLTGLIVLQEVDIEVGPLLAGAGIAGVALGFGAQNLVRDFLAGFFLVLENQVRVGDVARVNDTWGIVEQLTFRILVLRDLSGEKHIFPNGSINMLSNLTSEWSAYVFDLGVAYKENTDAVTDVIKEVGAGLRADPEFGQYILEDIEVFGVDQFADSAVVIKGRIKTQPLRQWLVGREFNRRIKLAFDERDIEIPFPHRSIYFGEASRPFELLKAEADGGDNEKTGSENN